MIDNLKKNQAFSLVELLVTVGIIAVLASSATVGFRYLGDTLRTKQAAGVIVDTIKLLELELLQNEYEESRIYFLAEYLVVVSELEGSTLDINWIGDGCIGYGSDGNLSKSDEDGEILSIISVTTPDSNCFGADFEASSEREWNYQITKGSDQSDVIRFIHFNVNRQNPSEITINPTNYSLEISAPYAKKQKYDDAKPTKNPIILNVLNSEGEEKETLTIN